MPKKLERGLEATAKAKGLRPGSYQYRAFVYGTMAHIRHEQIQHKDTKRGKANGDKG